MSLEKNYPGSQEILFMLGVGGLLTASIFMPGLGVAIREINKQKRKHEWEQLQKEWAKFNFSKLRRNLLRLQEQNLVEIVNQDGQEVIKLTQKGRTKYLKFKLEKLSLKGKPWDSKWRLVIYDIEKLKKHQQESFRGILKRMNFLLLQKSVYLTPYKCQEEIEYLREYFNLGKEVLYLEVSKLENENLYKKYFGL